MSNLLIVLIAIIYKNQVVGKKQAPQNFNNKIKMANIKIFKMAFVAMYVQDGTKLVPVSIEIFCLITIFLFFVNIDPADLDKIKQFLEPCNGDCVVYTNPHTGSM
jgi:hypothetical protein